MAEIPPPPPGFTLDKDSLGAVPPPPPGFKLDQPTQQVAPSKPSRPSFGQQMADVVEGVPNVARDIGEDFTRGLGSVKQGFQQATKAYQSPQFKTGEFAGGVGKMVGGVGESAGALGTGTARALVGDPIRKSGVPGSETAASLIEAGAGLVSPGGIAKAVPTVGRAIKAAGEVEDIDRSLTAAERAGRQVEALQKARAPVTSQAAGKTASDLYAEAEKAGSVLTPEFTNKFIQEASNLSKRTEMGKSVVGNTALDALAERLTPHIGKPMSLAEAQDIDEGLNKLISRYEKPGGGGLTDEGQELLQLKEKFRDMIENTKAADIEGGKNGFDLWKSARKAYSQTMKMRDLERIQTRAELSEQPVTALRQGLKTILSNPKKLKAFDKDEIAAMRRAHATGKMNELLRITGSRLTPIIMGGTGHIPGAIAAHAVSGAARRAATTSQMQKFEDLMRTVGSKVPRGPKTDLEALSQ